jgi:hypothetical protein
MDTLAKPVTAPLASTAFPDTAVAVAAGPGADLAQSR